jgi:hypothetical protein
MNLKKIQIKTFVGRAYFSGFNYLRRSGQSVVKGGRTFGRIGWWSKVSQPRNTKKHLGTIFQKEELGFRFFLKQ